MIYIISYKLKKLFALVFRTVVRTYSICNNLLVRSLLYLSSFLWSCFLYVTEKLPSQEAPLRKCDMAWVLPFTSDSKTTIKLNKIRPTGTRDFNMKNHSNKEEKKPRAPASNTSLFRVSLQTRRDLQCVAYPVRRLTRGTHRRS